MHKSEFFTPFGHSNCKNIFKKCQKSGEIPVLRKPTHM